nr:unnamed protein product [Callosobruchus chinensis]
MTSQSIDFRNPNVGKPANLKNSAVLRMLEEEENMQRNGYGPGAKRVAWPPPNEAGLEGPYSEHSSVPSQGSPAPSYQQQQQYYEQQQAAPPSSVPLAPLDVRSQASSSPLPSPHQSSKGWAPVHSPAPTPAQPAWSAPPPKPSQPAWRAPASTSPQPEYRPAPAPSSSSPASAPVYQPAAWKHPSKPVLPESEVNDSLPLWRKPTSTHYEAAHQPVSQQTYLGQQYLGDLQKNKKPQEKKPLSGAAQGQQPYNSAQSLYQSQAAPQQQNGYQGAHNQSNFDQSSSNQYNQSNSNQFNESNQYNRSQSTQSNQSQSQSVHQYSQSQSSQQVSQQYQPSAVQQRETSQYQTVQHYQSPGGHIQQQQQSVQQQSYQATRQYEVHTTQQYSSANPNVVKSTQTIKEVKTESTPQGVQSVTQFSTTSSNSPQTPLTENQFGPKSVAAPSQVAPRPQAKPVAPPPSTITLRPQAPISQVPAPLVTSQPATATLKEKLVSPRNLRGDIKWPPEEVKKKMIEEAQNQQNCNSFLSLEGGKHLRGDLKWPPENVKSQMEEENRLRLELAKGPAVRPPKQLKDYTGFFEQHALSDTYPGYKIPPGTQFYRPV